MAQVEPILIYKAKPCMPTMFLVLARDYIEAVENYLEGKPGSEALRQDLLEWGGHLLELAQEAQE